VSAAVHLVDSGRVKPGGLPGGNTKVSSLMSASAVPAGDALLEARAIELWRGERHLLRQVAFTLTAGELLQITGANGAGKTSLLRVVCGLLPPESGDILWRGNSIRAARDAFHRDLVYLAHLNALKLDLTADENLRAGAGLRRTTTRAARLGALEALGVAHCAELPGRVLSAGQRRRVAFARVLLSNAMLWVLDEPTTNLDASGVAVIERLLESHLQQGGAVLTAAHHGLLAGHARVRELALSA
jgi:heme exporter protein A